MTSDEQDSSAEAKRAASTTRVREFRKRQKLGLLVRTASTFGVIYMLSLLFSSNYPGPHAPLWQYFGASLDHSVLALCFAAFAIGHADRILSVSSYARRRVN